MKYIKTLSGKNFKREDLAKIGCGECQTSCQSACKTSCTVGNQKCEQKIMRQGTRALSHFYCYINGGK